MRLEVRERTGRPPRAAAAQLLQSPTTCGPIMCRQPTQGVCVLPATTHVVVSRAECVWRAAAQPQSKGRPLPHPSPHTTPCGRACPPRRPTVRATPPHPSLHHAALFARKGTWANRVEGRGSGGKQGRHPSSFGVSLPQNPYPRLRMCPARASPPTAHSHRLPAPPTGGRETTLVGHGSHVVGRPF